MTAARSPEPFRWRAWGRYHRDLRLILLVSLVAGAAIFSVALVASLVALGILVGAGALMPLIVVAAMLWSAANSACSGQLGWVVGGPWYASLQALLGFDAGYAVNFVTIIALYSVATALYWTWFRAHDRRRLEARWAA